MNKPALLAQYRDHMCDRSPQYGQMVGRFLDYCEALDKENVEGFMSQLQRQKFRAGTRLHYFGVLRTFFKVVEQPWPFHKGEAPRVTEQDEFRPALSLGVVTQMVGAARAGRLLPECVPLLAFATTYGPRRGEMVAVGPDDVRGGLIFVHTLKGGRQRWHQIPDAIQPILSPHDWSHRYSPGRMSQLFWDVVNGTGGLDGLKRIRLGWHSVRRPLLKGLIDNGCSTLAAKRFLRWSSNSQAGDDAMPARYYANTEVGVEGEVEEEVGPINLHHILLCY